MTRLPWPLVFQVLGVVAAVWLVAHTWQIWTLVFVAVIVAAAVMPAARLGERRGVPRGITVLVVYLAIAGVLVLMGYWLWPALREQWLGLMDQLPRLVDNARRWLGALGDLIEAWGGSLPMPGVGSVQGIAAALAATTLRITAGAFGALVAFFAILVLSAYIVIDLERLGHGIVQLFPPAQRQRVAELGRPVLDVIGSYVRGQLLVSLCAGVIIGVGLSLLGVRYALLIGAVAAVLNVVPFVGSFVAGVLGVLSALSDSPGLALATAGLFVGEQLLEGKVLAPQLMARATGLHPVPVGIALLVGAHLAGLVGVLVAVPLVAASWEIVRRLYVTPGASEPARGTPRADAARLPSPPPSDSGSRSAGGAR